MEFKVPFYNVVNILFIGLVFCGFGALLYPNTAKDIMDILSIINSQTVDVVILLAISYEMGLIINWVGSLVVEPILVNRKPEKQRGFLSKWLQISWRNYKDYQKAENDKLKMLTREMNVARNHFTLFVVLAFIASVSGRWEFCLCLMPLVVMFYCAYRKHSWKIVSRIDATLEQ